MLFFLLIFEAEGKGISCQFNRDYLAFCGNVPIYDGVVPLLVTGGLGLTHFSPEDTLLSDETRFSMNIGLATKIAVSENISLRVGGRVYAIFFNLYQWQ